MHRKSNRKQIIKRNIKRDCDPKFINWFCYVLWLLKNEELLNYEKK
jgi:hypothetical protein